MNYRKATTPALLAALFAAAAAMPLRADDAPQPAQNKAPAQAQTDDYAVLESTVSVRMKAAPLSSLCEMLSANTRLNFVLDSSLSPEMRITMFLRGVKVKDIFYILRRLNGIAVEKTGDKTYALKKIERELTVTEVGSDGGETTRVIKTGALEVPAGYRGATINLKTEKIGSLRPGDRIDVLVTFDAMMNDKSMQKVTATILQNVLVLDVLRGPAPEAVGAVKLALNSVEAEYNALAAYQGDEDIARRAPDDTEMHPMEMASLSKLDK
jgi:hypothetical protein